MLVACTRSAELVSRSLEIHRPATRKWRVPWGIIAARGMVGTTPSASISLSKPEPEEKLLSFYREAQPMGWWGPIAEKAGTPSPGSAPIARGLGTALLGAVAVGGGIIGLSGFYVGRWEVALTGGLLALVLGFWFKRTYATVADQS